MNDKASSGGLRRFRVTTATRRFGPRAAGLATMVLVVAGALSSGPSANAAGEYGTTPTTTGAIIANGSAASEVCATQAPDATVWVTSTFSVDTVKASGSGFYAYGDRACKSFIADIKMATYSPSVEFAAGAYDLPGSQSFGKTIPVLQHDCGRFGESVRFYRAANNSPMSLVGTAEYVGIWDSSGTCVRTVKSSSGGGGYALPSDSGWDTYRVAVRAKLRSSYQEVALRFIPRPPK